MKIDQRWFLSGLFLITLSTLLLEVLDTRLLSVLTWYHLSFFAVSMAMFGLAAGAVRVYLGGSRFQGEGARDQLQSLSLLYALSIPVLHVVLVRVPLKIGSVATGPTDVLLPAFSAAILLAIPFYLAGMVIGIALTRMPGRIGVTYSVDLAGAALGCLLAVLLLQWSDISTATFAAATLAVAGALCLQRLGGASARPGIAVALLPLFVVGTIWNGAAESDHAIRLTYEKGQPVNRDDLTYERWNSHSQIMVAQAKEGPAAYWGPGRGAERFRSVTSRLIIDGSAYTDVTEWHGDRSGLDWVQFDVTATPYHLRPGGDAAVIGVGGGRDVLTALWARCRSVTGIELNGILVDLLNGRLRQFAGIADQPEVKLVHDEARSYLTRVPEQYDILQMSLIDSWASTSAGAFTLSENGLYTREGWHVFLDRLKPNGIFSTSRWFAPGRISETSRLLALATSALLDRGSNCPADHMALLVRIPVATLLVSPSPLSLDDCRQLEQIADRFEFEIVAMPGRPPRDPILARILASRSQGELSAATQDPTFDFSAPDDSCPYFFNLVKPAGIFRVETRHDGEGVIAGNMLATATLLLLLLVAATLVFLVILLPLWLAGPGAARPPRFAQAVLYFALIGVGFMLVQIPYMQRFSVYLGHPTYAVVVILFSMILFAGAGSMLSELLPFERHPGLFLAVPAAVATALAVAIVAMGPVIQDTISYPLVTRCLIVLAFTAPVSLLLGCCFPMGMRLLGRLSDTAASWMWGVNGACSVLASAGAVCLSMWVGINASLTLAVLCYAALTVPAMLLLRAGANLAKT
jgi:hypothetical protein